MKTAIRTPLAAIRSSSPAAGALDPVIQVRILEGQLAVRACARPTLLKPAACLSVVHLQICHI